MKDPPWEGEEKNCKQISNRALRVKYLRISILEPIREHYSLTNFCYLSLFSIKTCFFVIWFMKAQFSNSFSTNLLFLAILGLSPYTRWARSLNQVLTIGAICGENTWVIVSVMFNHGRFKATTGRVHRIPTSKSFCQFRAKKRSRRECA